MLQPVLNTAGSKQGLNYVLGILRQRHRAADAHR